MTERPSILVSWVGHADLLGMAATLPAVERTKIEKLTGKHAPSDKAAGPVRAAIDIDGTAFQEVHLIADLEPALLSKFGRWLGRNVKTHRVKIDNPTHYPSVFQAAHNVIENIFKNHDQSKFDLWIALSSGTPAMAATLVLLGKSRFPARFAQSFKGKAAETDIPFDLTVDFLPELLRDPDANLQLLADKSPSEVEGFDAIVGNSKAIKVAVGRAKRAAIRDISVLILGESGTGKELFARALHNASPRRDKPFVAVNCAGIPTAQLQTVRLFGHKKNAFTGAEKDMDGAFHEANGGTLFLDEFGELDPAVQISLLRALQPGKDDPPCRRTFRPLGAKIDERVDVRIVAATNRDPFEQIKDKKLREDLLYRVATFSMTLPPLRGRRSDIESICSALLDRINRDFSIGQRGYDHKKLSPAAVKAITRMDWPGNVRQLYNVLIQSAVLCDGATIGKVDVEGAISQLPSGPSGSTGAELPLGDGFSMPDHLSDLERQYICKAYVESDGVKKKAAKLLGLKSYQALDAKLNKLGIEWSNELAG